MYYTLETKSGYPVNILWGSGGPHIQVLKRCYNFFQTKEEATKYLEMLRAEHNVGRNLSIVAHS
jgi:hypothetical protein